VGPFQLPVEIETDPLPDLRVVSQFGFWSHHQRRASQLAPAKWAELHLNASLSNGDLPIFAVLKKKTSASLIYRDKEAKSRFFGMDELF
jgi:hypothetical protein